LADVSRQVVIPIPLLCNAGLETKLSELKDAAQYVMDLYVSQEEWVEPKQLVDRLDEVEGCIKSLLLDAAHLAAAAALSTVKHIIHRSTCRRFRDVWTCWASSGVKKSWRLRARSSRSSTSALTEEVLKGAF
jgi:hypothetical protein